MGQKSKVDMLPEKIKTELNKRLVLGRDTLDTLMDWLHSQGCDIVSRSGLHRYGQQFDSKLAAIKIATEQAKAVAEAASDDEGAMNEALIRLVQQKSFDVLVNLQDEEVNLPKMGVMIAKLSKASVDQKKWMAEVRQKAKATADEVVKVAKKGGLSGEKAEEIRKKILGIV